MRISFANVADPEARDRAYMRRALRLAILGRHASPNPMVGCVIAAPDGVIVGEGYHPEPGMPHAEVYALRQAGDQARGATAYVTLEPCAHHGRTPPCADALLQSGVRRVVAAMRDPNRVAAGGLERLQAAGVQVSVGVEEARARELNAAFIKLRTTGLPWVVLKTAASLDGKIATRTGASQWISSLISRTAVHRQLRDRCDAILTGIGTVLADNPRLTTRFDQREGRDPLRIIVDSQCRTPRNSQVARRAREDGKTLIATTETASSDLAYDLHLVGCGILTCKSDANGQVDLPDLMQQLGTRDDILSVLIEGGGRLTGSLMDAGLVDRWIQYVAPMIIGGADAPTVMDGLGVSNLEEARTAQIRHVRRSGGDLVIDARIG